MGKKVANAKLKVPGQNAKTKLSVFNTFANKLSTAHKRHSESLDNTKKRLMESKKTNSMLRLSKRSSRFALLDDNDNAPMLTHKGKPINELKEFNDMEFGEQEHDAAFDELEQELNFTGFENNEREGQHNDSTRRKSKNEVYKEIIDKSKHYKLLRQEQYEENYNTAVALDEKFEQLMPSLQFRNSDTNIRERIGKGDVEFDRLASMLKEEERVVSNKIVEKSEKYTEKMRARKNELLVRLMKEDDDEEEDVRVWVQGVVKEEENEDELEEVQLSSDDDEDEDEDDMDEDGDEDDDMDEDDYMDEIDAEAEDDKEENDENDESSEYEKTSNDKEEPIKDIMTNKNSKSTPTRSHPKNKKHKNR